MQSKQLALTSVITIRIYQTSDGPIALHTVEVARGSLTDKALDAAHRSLDAIRKG